jgi:hypothetical protein
MECGHQIEWQINQTTLLFVAAFSAQNIYGAMWLEDGKKRSGKTARRMEQDQEGLLGCGTFYQVELNRGK